MAHRKCFNGVADDLNSGQYISRKKAKTIYKASVDLAQQPIPGVYQKKTSTGQKKGIYVGDINISRGETPASGAAPQQSGCLIGATSYASLSSVTEGKYLVDPINFDIRRAQDMWVGSIYAMDMSGATTLIPYPGASPPYNTFLYPPSSDSNQIYPNYPDPSNNNIGPVVDPCYNIFYPIGVEQSSRGTCYLKNERAYKQYLKCLPYTTEQAKVYAKAQNGYIGDIFYPKKFHFGCDQLWINDISHCLTAELGGRNNRNSGSGGSGNYTLTPTITGVTMSWGSVLNAEAGKITGHVGVNTSGVENGQVVTVTLNGKDYTAYVSSNTMVTIPAFDLQALTNGSYTVTANVSNADGIAAATFTGASFTVDTTKPVLTQVTPIETPSNNTTPTYVFKSDQAGTITYSGGNGATSSTTDAIVGDNSITFNILAQETYSNITITVTDAVGNVSTQLAVPTFVIDTTKPDAPTVSFPTSPSNNGEVTVTLATGATTWEYSVDSGNNWSNGTSSNKFTLIQSTYAIDSIQVRNTDAAGNTSASSKNSSQIIIDTTKPVLTQVTPIETPSNNDMPTYVFSSTQTGTITYSGGNGATSSTTTAIVDDNSITFSKTVTTVNGVIYIPLTQGTYDDIKITVTDAVGNVSDALHVPTFVIDTTDPNMTIKATNSSNQEVTNGSTTNDATITLTFTSSEATNDFVKGDITLVNGELSNFTGSGEDYTAIFTPNANGVCTIKVAAATFTDTAGNSNNATSQFIWTQDTTLPSMTITSSSVADGATTNNASIDLTFTSSEATDNFVNDNITLVNGTLSAITGSGKVYSATFTPTDDGVCTIDVAANEFTDGYDNYNEASNTFTWTFDGTVIINGTGIFTVDDWTGADSPPAFEIGSGFTSVGASALNAQTSITKVIIGNGVTSIGTQAFYYCSKLNNVSFESDSVLATIGNEAFGGCSAITGPITLPKSVTSIGNSAFYHCSKLTSISFESGSVLTTINTNAFYGCSAMTEITIPASVESIGEYAFYICSKLTSVTFKPNSVLTTIGTYAFYGCSVLTGITIPALVTSIGSYAFQGCSKLTSVSFDQNSALTEIGEYTFQNCSALTGITIPALVTSIGTQAFHLCSKLTSVTFDQNSALLTIDGYAFSGCSVLTEITIPASVNNIGTYAFENCNVLANVLFLKGSDITVISDIGTNAFQSSGLGTVYAYSDLITTMEWSTSVPNTNTIGGKTPVTVVGTVVIEGTGEFTVDDWTGAVGPNAETGPPAFEIGSGFTSVGASALHNQSSITQVIIGNSVTSITDSAFNNCSNLIYLIFESGSALTKIGKYAFKATGLTGITLPASLTSSGDAAFSACSSLSSVSFESGSTMTKIDNYSFQTTPLTSITIPKLVTSIGDWAFSGDPKLTTVLFESDSQLETIGQNAFQGQENFDTITIPASVTQIATEAFKDCTKLKTVYFLKDSAITESSDIGTDAFQSSGLATVYADSPLISTMTWSTTSPNTIGGQTGVTVVGTVVIEGTGEFIKTDWTEAGSPLAFIIGPGFTSVAVNAFGSTAVNCTDIIIGNGVTSIGSSAFDVCSSLISLSFESGSVLTTIGEKAFSGCQAMTGPIPIPASVESIGKNAFYGCSKLTTVSFEPESQLETIGQNAFWGSGLTSITIPNLVTTIGNYSFYVCSSLTSVSFESGSKLETIGSNAFSGSGLTSITIPNLVTTIGNYSFASCSKFTTLYFAEDSVMVPGNPGNPIGIGTQTFSNSGLVTVNAYIDLITLMSWNITDGTVPPKTNTIGGKGGVTVNDVGLVVINETSGGTEVFTNDSWTGAGSPIVFEIGSGFTSVEDNALSGESSITQVIIGNEVLTIGQYAFANCSKLTNVTFESVSQLKTIGEYAFQSCSAMTEITIPDTVTTINGWAFWYCTGLTEINIPVNVSSIGNNVFGGASSLTSITVAATNTHYKADSGVLFTIGETTLISYPAGNTRITYEIPDTVTTIGQGAFTAAVNLTSITLNDNLGTIGENAFQSCSGLTNIAIPTNVTIIGNAAFNSCSALTTVTFTAGSLLETINNSAFWYCTGLTEITIPANVTSIGTYVFGGASSLTSITVADGNENYKAIDGVLFTIDETTLHTYPGGKTDSTGGIETSYIIPDTVTTIGQAAFYTAIQLASVTISTKVETIGVQAFDTTKVASINIPASVSSIGQQAFNTPDLTSITVDTSNTHYKAIDGVLFGLNGTTITTLIQYPIGKTDSSYEIPNTVTTIGSHALYQARSLTSVTFQSGSTLKTIGSLAFSIIPSMSTIDIPSSVTTIGSQAFQNSGLTEITIPHLVESIGAYAFLYCSNLKNVSFDQNSALTTSSDIGTNAFQYSGLSTVNAYSTLISNMNWTVSNSTTPPTMNDIGGKEGVTVVETVVEPLTLMVSQTIINTGIPTSNGTDNWLYQSFTATQTCKLKQIVFYSNSTSNGSVTIIIRNGQGIGGTEIYRYTWNIDTTGNAAMKYNISSDVNLTNGEQYSIELTNINFTSGTFSLQVQEPGSYGGGQFESRDNGVYGDAKMQIWVN